MSYMNDKEFILWKQRPKYRVLAKKNSRNWLMAYANRTQAANALKKVKAAGYVNAWVTASYPFRILEDN